MYYLALGRCGSLPFNAADFDALVAVELQLEYKVPDHVPHDAAQIIGDLLMIHPSDRLSIWQLAASDYVSASGVFLGPLLDQGCMECEDDSLEAGAPTGHRASPRMCKPCIPKQWSPAKRALIICTYAAVCAALLLYANEHSHYSPYMVLHDV